MRDQALFWRMSSADSKWGEESGCNNLLRFRTSCWDLDTEAGGGCCTCTCCPFPLAFIFTAYTRGPQFLRVQNITESLIMPPFGLFFPAIKVLIKAGAKDV